MSFGAGERYEVWLGVPGSTEDDPEQQVWTKYLTFRELERAMHFMECYDPDGNIPMKVYDLWKKKDVDISEYLYEHDRRVAAQKRKQEQQEDNKGNWHKEGF